MNVQDLPNSFSREQAEELLLVDGIKISHELFSNDEYIVSKNGRIYDEEGYLFDDWVSIGPGAHNGFRMRSGESWNFGWRLYTGGDK